MSILYCHERVAEDDASPLCSDELFTRAAIPKGETIQQKARLATIRL